ncbi:D-alanyl-D-alanine carboxypeptidase family protein [Paenibacillus marinisediminis]
MRQTMSEPQQRQSRSGVKKKRIGRKLLGVMLLAAGLLWMLQIMNVPIADRTIKKAYGQALQMRDQFMMSTNNRMLAQEQISATAATVIDAATGEILFYKNDKKRLPPASTTKIMTALVALESTNPDEGVMVGDEVLWTEEDESTAGLKPGQLMTWQELITAMMLPSGNDAARTIAVQVGMKYAPAGATREEAYQTFVQLMNKRAASLGMNDTHYMNPHGMHDKRHYTTANDLSKLAREAMNNELFREIVEEKQDNLGVTYQDQYSEQTVVNRNQLLQPDSSYYYEGAIGIKTGFTDQAGYCLVSSAVREGTEVIAVVLHSGMEEVWTDSHALLDYGFECLL